MAEHGQDKIMAFDTLFTTNTIQIFKILLPYMEPARHSHIAVYIKFLELQYTINFFQNHPTSRFAGITSLSHNVSKDCEDDSHDSSKYCAGIYKEELNINKLYHEILPFCSTADREKLTQLKNMYDNYTNMQEMMQMVQMMKEMFPEGENPIGNDPSSIFSGLSGFSEMFGSKDNSSGMDISQIFEMFSSMKN